MILTVYDDIKELAKDLIEVSVLNKKDIKTFIEETAKENISVCFFDNDDNEFTCHVWFNDINTTKEDDLIGAIVTSWALYCKVTDESLLTYMKTSSLLANTILKSLKELR